jgi:multidrug efflux pump subunit AcrB
MSVREPKLGIAGHLTRTFIASPLTPLLLIAALAMGVVALIVMPREEEPQISVPMVDIFVSAAGLKAEDAAKLVTEPLETIVKSIDEVEHVYSQTRDDQVLVTARFKVGVLVDTAVMRVREKVQANIERIPLGIPQPVIIARGIDDVAILTLSLSPRSGGATSVTTNDLTRVARELRVELSKINNVGLTYLSGGVDEAIRVAPDPEKLALYGVTLQQLAGKVQSANRAFPAGNLRRNGQQIGLIVGATLTTPKEIDNLVLTTRDGRPVYISDVADVALTGNTAETITASYRQANGKISRVPLVTLAIAKRAGSNAVTVAETVLNRVEALRGDLIPDGVVMEVTRNFGKNADDKANELLYHLVLATVSIIALVWLTIGWREAIVVAVVIPTTVLLTLFAANAMGYTLNRVSLFALIFSIGILVDDAIVVIENIARHWGLKVEGNRRTSAITAVAEVGNPTIVATLTVVVALLPMLFVSGLMGPYMSPIPAVASAAMIFSFFVAVTITPWLMLKTAGKAPLHNMKEGPHGGRLGQAYAFVARPILATKARSWLFLLIIGAMTVASLSLFYTKSVTVKLLPFDNKSELSVIVDMAEGTALEVTDATAQKVVSAVLRMDEVISAQTYAGTSAPFDFNGLVRHYYLRSQPNLGDVQIILKPKGERERVSHAIALDIRSRLKALEVPPGTSLKVVESPPGPPVLATLLAEIYGPDPETRRKVAAKVRKAFESVPFIVDVDDSFGIQAARQRVTISTENLDFFKVQESDVFDTLAILSGGRTVGYSHRDSGRQPIPIRVERARRDKVLDERFLSTPIPANLLPGARAVVELGDVVKVATEKTSYPIFRHNSRPAEMVTAELAGAFEAPLYGMLAVQKALDNQDWAGLPRPQIKLRGQPEDDRSSVLLWDGEWEITWVTFRDMGAAFAVALIGIYILVVAQFGSFSLPLVILTPVPLTFIGILLGHWWFGAPFSATSMIGFIALAGIIVRNSILLVDFIRHAASPERPLVDVLLEAGAIRFRPILLTALAAMIGAVVILTDPIFQGLAISLLFGLASSTLLTVLVVPAIYRVFKT